MIDWSSCLLIGTMLDTGATTFLCFLESLLLLGSGLISDTLLPGSILCGGKEGCSSLTTGCNEYGRGNRLLIEDAVDRDEI